MKGIKPVAKMQEKLSAMLDGEVDEQELDALIKAMEEDDAIAQTWQDYHLVSDAMHEQAPLSPDFMARFSERLLHEPTIFAPAAMRKRMPMPKKRWVALSMAASVVLVSATAWYVGPASQAHNPAALQVAKVPAQGLPLAASQMNQMNPYLQAHQTMVGATPHHRAVILTGAEAERLARPN